MRSAIVPSVAAMLLACAPPRPTEADSHTTIVPASSARATRPPLGDLPPDNILTTEPTPLLGTWHTRPITADPRDPDIAVIIDRQGILASSGCVKIGWRYRFIGQRIETRRIDVRSCERALSPEEASFADALDGATIAFHRGGRGLVFEGSGRRVVLFEHPLR